MNPEARRSACDRCRGQKLRCVRAFKHGGDDRYALNPCERCLKAGAECTNSFSHAQHKEQSQSSPVLHRRAGSARIYESISMPPTATADFVAVPVESIPAKRKMLPPFLEQSSHPMGTDPNSAPDKQKALAFGVEPLDFTMRLSPEEVHGHRSDQFIDMLFQEDPKITTSTTRAQTHNPPSSPLGSKEDCLHCISELSSQILRDANRIRSTPLADMLSSFSLWPDNRKGQPEPGLQNSIGRLLELTQAFLNILHYLRLALPSSAPPSSDLRSPPSPANESDCSFSEYWEDPEEARENHPVSSSFIPSVPNPIISKEPSPSSGIDMPAMMIILTCYIWLLHTYGTLFHRIHAACFTTGTDSILVSTLRSSPSSSSAHPLPHSASASTSSPSIPSVLSGLHIGGFDLNNHRDLQLEILLQLSSKMLGRIEEILGISLVSSDEVSSSRRGGGGSSGSGGILDRASASALLEVILKRNELGYLKEVDGGASSVKQTLDDIRETSRRIS